MRKLKLKSLTIRTLGTVQLTRVVAGFLTESDVCSVSDASTCPTHDWSCINMSCTLQRDAE